MLRKLTYIGYNMILSYNPNLHFGRPLHPPSNPEYIYAFFLYPLDWNGNSETKKIRGSDFFFVSPLIFIFFFMLTFIVDGQIYEYISQNEKSNE